PQNHQEDVDELQAAHGLIGCENSESRNNCDKQTASQAKHFKKKKCATQSFEHRAPLPLCNPTEPPEQSKWAENSKPLVPVPAEQEKVSPVLKALPVRGRGAPERESNEKQGRPAGRSSGHCFSCGDKKSNEYQAKNNHERVNGCSEDQPEGRAQVSLFNSGVDRK